MPIVNKNKLFSTQSTSNKLDPNYVTGFTDGEGCFYIGISPDNKSSSGFRIKLSFQIGLHEKDKELLNLIKFYRLLRNLHLYIFYYNNRFNIILFL